MTLLVLGNNYFTRVGFGVCVVTHINTDIKYLVHTLMKIHESRLSSSLMNRESNFYTQGSVLDAFELLIFLLQ